MIIIERYIFTRVVYVEMHLMSNFNRANSALSALITGS